MKPHKAAVLVAFGLLALGSWQLASAGWIHAKAVLAQHLIASAWADARDGTAARRPWPGADLRPVARLVLPRRNIDLLVLDAATPRSLAFGPAHVAGTAPPATWGHTVMVAHRDTHFAFLREVSPGEAIEVEGARGARASYRVREVAILDKEEARLIGAPDAAQLTLITCWPFDAVQPNSRLRYVVVAERVA